MLLLFNLVSRRCLSSSWLPLVGFSLWMVRASPSFASSDSNTSCVVPENLCSPFGAYPNPLGITDQDRASFHPVIQFPWIWSEQGKGKQFTKSNPPEKQKDSFGTKKRVRVVNARVADLTKPTGLVYLATEKERTHRRTIRQKIPAWQHRLRLFWLPPWVHFLVQIRNDLGPMHYSLGRYDEDRVGLYVSDMFEDTDYSVDGYAGARTVHVGIDLGGPVGTHVYAFADGIVHSAGYNPALGDYGNVVVVEHVVPSNGRKVWALYGHLDEASLDGKSPGQRLSRGQVIGRLGDLSENGGWVHPHVHFQLSTEPPETHDMPGAVALKDRPQALLQYPDPRWVLGPLY